MNKKNTSETYSVHFQNKPTFEQISIIYRNIVNDILHKEVLEQLENTKSNDI